MKRCLTHRQLVALLVACASSVFTTQSRAFEFSTLVFSEDFEAFADGHTISGAGNEAPSTGTGLIWQYIGSTNQQVEVTAAQGFGTGTKSADYVRAFLGVVPRYWTYPNPVPESNITANTKFGIQYDLNMTANEFVSDPESPYFGLSGMQMLIAPGGSPASAGGILNNGDGEIQAWDTVLEGYQRTGYFLGEGWQTIETSIEVGPSLGTTADVLITHFLTRHAGNSAGTQERIQIYQVTENFVLDANYRLDINNNRPSRFYLDNIKLGVIASDTLLTGDYNDDGSVDAADYTFWRDREGTSEVLPNDPIGGVIGSGQYDQWKNNFMPAAAVAAASAVPEPATLLMLLVGGLGAATTARRLS